MFLLFVSFISGVLTVLAPCILPLLPVIIGGAAQNHERRNPYIITASLAVAVVLFTLLLKFSTLFINVPPQVWNFTSGIIIIFFGLITIFPNFWDRFNFKFGLSASSDKMLSQSASKSGRLGDMLIGLSLGPVFSSCSPTYFLILATVLPQSFSKGILNLIAYALGLSLTLLLISILGQKFIAHARFAANLNGLFRRSLGVLFVLVGLIIFTGTDKQIQVFLANHGWSGVSSVEENLLNKISNPIVQELKFDGTVPNSNLKSVQPIPKIKMVKNLPFYREITNPSGFVNTAPLKIGDLVGKKIIIVDFMTYSCINCIRTFPYLNAWYDKYHDQGLEIIGIHTPEFSFEKNIDNVRKAIQGFGIKFPIVLDNDYGTWNAYGNNYWPHKYIIDIDGYIAYDHIGEGGYEETEQKIQELLAEKMARENLAITNMPGGMIKVTSTEPLNVGSPETYFGAARNEFFTNGIAGQIGQQKLVFPKAIDLNELTLVGDWNFEEEFAQTVAINDKVFYRYYAKTVHLVASSETPNKVEVLRDGLPLTKNEAGSDIFFENEKSFLLIYDSRLYNIINDQVGAGEHTLQFIIESPGLKAFAFTFG